jgi:membrane-associated PAP2 superfamily phosphatase
MIRSKISLRNNQEDFYLIVCAALICAALAWVNFSSIDLQIQNHLFDFVKKSWIIDKDEPVKKFIFYKFPKILLGLVILSCLVASLFGFKKISSKFAPIKIDFVANRHKFFLTFLGLVLITLIAGNIKKFTNVYCPSRLEIYGGNAPYVKIFESYPTGFVQEKKPACFPAGHPVTGFCLFILFFIFSQKFWRIFSFSFALVLGWIFGFYQMAKGAHFFGDVLLSMLVCFFMAAFISRLYKTFLVKDL